MWLLITGGSFTSACVELAPQTTTANNIIIRFMLGSFFQGLATAPAGFFKGWKKRGLILPRFGKNTSPIFQTLENASRHSGSLPK
jgi:hypothetical protein